MFQTKIGDLVTVQDNDKKCKLMSVIEIIDKGNHIIYILDTEPEEST